MAEPTYDSSKGWTLNRSPYGGRISMPSSRPFNRSPYGDGFQRRLHTTDQCRCGLLTIFTLHP